MKKTIIKTFGEFLDWFDSSIKIYSYDWETTSLDYCTMKPVGLSFCDGKRACYIDISKYEEPSCILANIKQKVFNQDDILFVAHNQVFDLKCCYDFCLAAPKNIFCTLIGSQLLNENLPFHNLKYLAEHWLKIPADQIKKWEGVSADVTSKEFANYGMNDAIWTYRLYELESKALKKQNLEHLFYNVEMPFQFVLRDLEINGVAVDKEEYESAKKDLSKLLEEAFIEMCNAAEVKYWYDEDLFGNEILSAEVNFDSPKQLIKLIEKKLGFEITERTKPSKTYPKGQKSFNKKVKASFKGKHPFFDLFLKFEELNNLLNDFMLPLEKYIDSDGRVRTSYGMKRTGRLSSSKPNLQNQPNPKKKKLIYNYRKIFVPGE